MSKRKTILLSLLVTIIVLGAVVAIYSIYRNRKASVPALTVEEIREQQRKELMSFSINPDSLKSEAEQKQELESFSLPASEDRLAEEEARTVLESADKNI